MADKEVIETLDGEDAEQPEQNAPSEEKSTSQAEELSVDSAEDESADGNVSKKDFRSLTKELEQLTDQLQRQAAEFQNYRRRTDQEKSQMVLFGKIMVIQQLLDVFDDFHRSIEASNQALENSDVAAVAAYESLKSGVELAYQKLMNELKKMDVVPIDVVGQPFDEEVHEAVMQQAVGDDEEVGVVISEILRGFRMGDRVLRHAKVVVSAEGEQNES
ncbi:MAG: nucleotide exchange factor GrpE [Rhodothermia bacterium]|nr:MAG: nucleotide exchange factor GrpE [Rhodothermia bacterium]